MNKRPDYGTRAIEAKRPRMPRTLSGEARAEWERVVPELEKIGFLSTVDRATLIRYCTVWADYVELASLLSQSTKLVRGARGQLVRNPLWLMRQEAEAAVNELSRMLGLNPIARLRAGIKHEQPRSEYGRDDGEPNAIASIEERRRAMMQG